MNPLTLIRHAKEDLGKAYDSAQKYSPVITETFLIDAKQKIEQAIIELRKDSHIA